MVGANAQLDFKTVRIFAYSSTYARAVKRGWKRRARLGRGAKNFFSRLTRPMVHKYMWCLICLVSPVLVKVYDVFPWLMYGQVRQPCLQLQRNVPTGGLSVLSLFVSFTRTSRSRSLVPERRKVTTGTSLKMFLKGSVDCWMGWFLRSMIVRLSWVIDRDSVTCISGGWFFLFYASFRGTCFALVICSLIPAYVNRTQSNSNRSIRWLDTVFRGHYLPSLSIN